MASALTFHVDPQGFLSNYPMLRSETRPFGAYGDGDQIELLNQQGEWEKLPRGAKDPKRPGFVPFKVSALEKGSIFRVSASARMVDESRALRARGEEIINGGFRPENPAPTTRYGTVAGRSSAGDQISVLLFETLKSAEHAAEEQITGRSRAWGYTTAGERTAALDKSMDDSLYGQPSAALAGPSRTL